MKTEDQTKIEKLQSDLAARDALIGELREKLNKTETELDRERTRLAACGVIALANTPASAADARNMLPCYQSASADDVARAVDREMELRALIGEWVAAAKGILYDPLSAPLHQTSLPALRSVLTRTPADAGAELERLRKEAKDALHERDCCHEIYDAIRRALGYPDGTGYPMLAPEVAKVIAERDALRAIFPRVLESLGSGACAPDCSLEFLSEIPREVGLVVGKLRAQLATAESRLRAVTESGDAMRKLCADSFGHYKAVREVIARYDAARLGKETVNLISLINDRTP